MSQLKSIFANLPFPFNPYEEWNPEQIKIWHRQICVEPTVMQVYDGLTPTIIYGVSGSGITTTLQLIATYERERGNFVVQWVPQEDVFTSAIQGVVETIAKEIIKRTRTIKRDPVAPSFLSDGSMAIWFWLLTTYLYNHDKSLAITWFQQYLNVDDCSPYDSFATHEQHPNPVRVLFWLNSVTRALGYDHIVCLSDHIPTTAIAYVQEWFRDPHLQDHPGILGISGLDTHFIALFQSNARIRRLRLVWDWTALWQICVRIVTAALQLENAVEIPTRLKPALEAMVTKELGQTPLGVKVLAVTLYWLYQRGGSIPDDVDVIMRDLYERSIPLTYDSGKKAIFRGNYRLEGLTEPQLQVFGYLYQHRNSIVTRPELCKDLNISNQNLDQIISRIRQVIEPRFQTKSPRKWIYLTTEQGWGYHLRT